MAQSPPALSIREVSERSGCSASALRYYEAVGMIAALPRGETQTRRYHPSVLHTLDIITALRGVGYGIAEITQFLSIKRPEASSTERLERAEHAIRDLKQDIQGRRQALDRAQKLLEGWQAEIDGAKRELQPADESR